MQIEKNIAATLRYKMEAEKKTKMELSEELGIPRSTFQGYLKGEKCLRSDSIEEIANGLGISPAQLISGPDSFNQTRFAGLDSILLEIQTLHPQAQTLAKEAVNLLNTALRISDALNGIEAQLDMPENPDDLYKYTVHEIRDPFRMTHAYGLLGKELTPSGWMTVSVVVPFSQNKTDVACLAKRCTELQLSPLHLLDVIQDYLAQNL